jgi:porphobilinogen deaminase
MTYHILHEDDFYAKKLASSIHIFLANQGFELVDLQDATYVLHLLAATKTQQTETSIVFKRPDVRDMLVVLSEEVHFENLTRSFQFACKDARTAALLQKDYPHIMPNIVAVQEGLLQLKSSKVDGWMSWIDEAKSCNHGGYLIQKFPLEAMIPEPMRGIYVLNTPSSFPYFEALSTEFHHGVTAKCWQIEEAVLDKNRQNSTLMVHCHIFMRTIQLYAATINEDGTDYRQFKQEKQLNEQEDLIRSCVEFVKTEKNYQLCSK